MEDTSVNRKLVFSLSAILALGAMAAFAADVTGKWVGEMPGRGGTPTQITFDFQQNGETLTGTITGGMGGGRQGGEPQPQEISEGKVSGDSISFAVVRTFGENEMRTTYTGTVSGSEMTLSSSRPGRGGGEPTVTEITAKKSE
jgi:hypothetical protein